MPHSTFRDRLPHLNDLRAAHPDAAEAYQVVMRMYHEAAAEDNFALADRLMQMSGEWFEVTGDGVWWAQ